MLDTTSVKNEAVQHQMRIEQLTSKNELMPRLRKEFGNSGMDFVSFFERHKIPSQFGIDFLIQMALHKRATFETVAGLMYRHFNDANQTAALIERMVQVGLADWDTLTQRLVTKITISKEIQDELDRFQYPMPMVVEPNWIKTNRQSGYLLNNSSVILRQNHHDDDVCLDHLNRANRVRLTINQDTALMVKNQWRHLDRPKAGEEQAKFEQRKRMFEKYDACSKDVMRILMTVGDTFWLTHRYDKRGRTYCQGYHVNYQGTPWNKAVVEFADKEFME